MENNKQAALEFLRLVSGGKVDEGYERYVDMTGKHHNPYYSAGFAALRKGMKESDVQFPDKTMEVRHAIAEGDLVAVHSLVRLKPGEMEVAVVHLFRFANGKIAEMWDVGQQVPAKVVNSDGVI